MAMTAKTSVDSVRLEMISQMGFRHSSKPEQTQIGGYFREVDRLIGLQQRKHDKLVTLKKAMLQKMFPQPGTTTPEIRFKGFSGAWVEKKLGDSTINVSNNTLSRANLNYRSGLARNVHYGDILVQYGEVLDVQNNGIPFISDDALARKLKSSNLQDGDIVVADAAEDEIVGKCTEIQNVGDQIVLAGLHTIALRPLTHFAPFYLGYYLNSDAFHDQLLPIMQGTKVLSVSKTTIKQTVIRFPTVEAEQQKIGRYFRTLDELISQHALQLEKLKQLKSACLEKMFV
jgi:type I restriction enzyme S subunit